MKKENVFHLFSLIFLIIAFSFTKCSKFENEYIVESITYNNERTSVSVNIKYNSNPSDFSILNYELENPRTKASVKIVESLIFEFNKMR